MAKKSEQPTDADDYCSCLTCKLMRAGRQDLLNALPEPTPAQMSCGFALYGPPALCTCGTCK